MTTNQDSIYAGLPVTGALSGNQYPRFTKVCDISTKLVKIVEELMST